MYIPVSDGGKTKRKADISCKTFVSRDVVGTAKELGLKFPTVLPLAPSAPHPQRLETAAWLSARAASSCVGGRKGEKEAAAGRWKGWRRRPERVFFEALCALPDLFLPWVKRPEH